MGPQPIFAEVQGIIMAQLSKIIIRPATVNLLARLIFPLTDSGLISGPEYEEIVSNLRHLSRHGTPIPAIPTKLIPPQEVAELLSISYSQFRALEKEGAFPFQRRMIGGKTVRYLNTEIVSYMQGHEDCLSNKK